jgi:hypothetical protein
LPSSACWVFSGEGATTYYYAGSPFTEINTAIIRDFAFNELPNPNAAADAALFGTNLTGFATFNFDTTGFTGTLPTGVSVTGQLTSGIVSASLGFHASAFTFANGAITSWGPYLYWEG